MLLCVNEAVRSLRGAQLLASVVRVLGFVSGVFSLFGGVCALGTGPRILFVFKIFTSKEGFWAFFLVVLVSVDLSTGVVAPTTGLYLSTGKKTTGVDKNPFFFNRLGH